MNLLSIDIVDPVGLSPREQLLSFIPLLILIGILLIIVLVIGLVIYKKKKTFSTKTFFLALLFISFFFSTIIFTYLYLSELKKQDVVSKTDSDTLLYDSVIRVRAKDILDGEIEDGSCLDTCEANLEITYNDDFVVLNNVLFSHSIQGIRPIYNNLFDKDSNYYVLRYGSGEESGTYVFNNKGYKSKTFCSVDYGTEPSVLLDNKSLLYNDCGVASTSKPLLGGISMVNLDTGEIESVIEPITGKIEKSYNLLRFDSSNNSLSVEECSYTEEKPVCDEKITDISDII